jgi:hypothetical protein
MEDDMTTARKLISLIAPVIAGAALWTASPAAALSGADGRAVAQCRARMLSHFEQGEVRSYRVASISGGARRTRVTIIVDADRRYTFDCAANAGGEIVTAAFDPARPATAQLASGQGNPNQPR